MKYTIIIVILIGLVTGFTACDSNKAKEHNQTAEVSHDGDAHAGEHIYTCPMGCEGSQSDKPGKCPICGMELEHTDKALNGKSYRIDFTSDPAQLEANKAGTLRFTPREEGNDKGLVPLDVVHEKKMHLIIVSKDLSYFEHIHPEYNADGSMQINVLPVSQAYTNGNGQNETKFEYGGEYVMFADYNPTGSTHQLARIPVTVKGKEKSTVKYSQEDLTWEGNGYTVKLTFDKSQLKAKESAMLKTTVHKNGKPVTDLENYLGALGHMVVISEDTEDYLHVHPLDSETKGPDVSFHSSFKELGFYRVFLQFLHQGAIQTSDFTIRVHQGDANATAETHQH